MADTETDGKKMAIGISVDGNSITAYACNGVDDEAWFFGNQADGAIDITSKFRDTLNASFTGSDVKGDLTMNGVTYDFTAAPVSSPAGMYTAALDGVRASWIVRPDGSVTGVQFNGGITGRDFEQAELQQLNTAQFQTQVRNKRILQQADQSVKLAEQQAHLEDQRRGRDRRRSSRATRDSPDRHRSMTALPATCRRGRSLFLSQNRTLHAPGGDA